MMKEHEHEGPMNEELKALEAHMLSVSKQGNCRDLNSLEFKNSAVIVKQLHPQASELDCSLFEFGHSHCFK